MIQTSAAMFANYREERSLDEKEAEPVDFVSLMVVLEIIKIAVVAVAAY